MPYSSGPFKSPEFGFQGKHFVVKRQAFQHQGVVDPALEVILSKHES